MPESGARSVRTFNTWICGYGPSGRAIDILALPSQNVHHIDISCRRWLHKYQSRCRMIVVSGEIALTWVKYDGNGENGFSPLRVKERVSNQPAAPIGG